MNYLARLKLLGAGAKSPPTPKHGPTKPTEAPFDGFVGSNPGANENIFVASNEVESVTSWAWLLHFADREPLEVYCHPPKTHAAILERYPDVLAAESIPARIGRTPTQIEATELRALVLAVGTIEQWDADLLEWAIGAALADPDAALECYRALLFQHRIILSTDDDRRACRQCANLSGRRCLAASRGEIVANRDYEPVRDLPRRCEGYMPGVDDPDRRPGGERWPHLIQEGANDGEAQARARDSGKSAEAVPMQLAK